MTEPGLGDHYAPGDTDRKARRVFWRPFDKELTEHVGITLKPDRKLIAATRAEQQVSDQIERNSLFRKRVYAGEDATPPADTDAQPGARP